MMQVVQNAQGRNMPLRLQMERRIVSRVSWLNIVLLLNIVVKFTIVKWLFHDLSCSPTDSKDASPGEFYGCSGDADRNGQLPGS